MLLAAQRLILHRPPDRPTGRNPLPRAGRPADAREEDAWSESYQQEIPIFREIFGYDHVPLQPADIDWEPSSEEENADVGPV